VICISIALFILSCGKLRKSYKNGKEKFGLCRKFRLFFGWKNSKIKMDDYVLERILLWNG